MIEGKKRESREFGKFIGLFEAEVIAVNPSAEEYEEMMGYVLSEESKKTEYLGESKDGNATVRIDVYLKAVGKDFIQPVTFFLENKERENKDFTKKQYINSVGMCSWADTRDNLPDWFTKNRDVRVAFSGEEELHSLMRLWLNIDFKDEDAMLLLDWKKLIKGNTKEIREQIGSSLTGTFGALATVINKERDGEMKEYQSVYNRAFLPTYSLKHFRLVDYSSPEVLDRLKAKKPRDLKAHEKFALEVNSEYGCKDSYILKDLREYNAEDFLVASDKVISSDGSDY